ncbi:bestrophin family protein [Novosphingobium taihuense]|uniref:Putative membrane protein n=1 Tax=Novosphingobium taihuense TaxID=260085 RepID=A0A7W7ESP9_9SPHN|nr:bestrophin family ion channel [Novosphingobium taihuense]MBB4612422.1 putative membrane protein [Novosphingobium taihuense]TWH88226.1 putative membrane protein [Novosphingobium taihuense]
MITKPVPSLKTIISEVWKPALILFVWDVVVTITYYVLPFRAPELPFTLFGSAVALFLGFRSNSAYQRWWEARSLWGLMINASRNIGRAARNFMPDPEGAELKRQIAFRQIAYVNALRCQLRRQPLDDVVLGYIEKAEASSTLERTNVANGLLDGLGRKIDEARRAGWLDTIQQTQMERVLVDIANAQGGMERIKNTPLPNHYRFFPVLFVHMFCVLLPFGLVETLGFATPLGSTIAGLMFLAVLAIGDDLVDPFANSVHDLPLCAMCRTIEIDLLQSMGLEAPEPIVPDRKGILW